MAAPNSLTARALAGRGSVMLAAPTAAVILIPYATVPLPGARLAFVVQAAAILGVVAATVILGVARPGWPARLAGVPRVLSVGVACWALAATSAALAAVVRGNEPALAAGQLLALGLLPLGAVAAAALRVDRAATAFAAGLAGATLVACGIHMVGLVNSLVHRQTVLRLYLPNDVAPVHVVMLGVLIVLAAALSGALALRLAVPAVALIALYILGSGVRSLWVVVPAAVAVLAVVSGALRLLVRPRALGAIAAIIAAACAVALAFHAWVTLDRPTVLAGPLFAAPTWQLPADPAAAVAVGTGDDGQAVLRWTRGSRGERPIPLTRAFPVEPETAYLLAVEVEGTGHGGGRVFVVWAGENGASAERYGYLLQNAGSGRGRQRLVTAGVSPAGARTAYIAVALRDGATSSWAMYDLRVSRLGSPVLATFYAQLTFMGQRVGSLVGLADPTGQNLEGISGRLGETRFLLQQVRDAGPGQKLVGAGLGARYPMKLRNGQDAHYIHNFYAFLLYKTGIIGTALVLAAMSLWIGFTFVAARRSRDPWRRAFLWAVFSAWIGYAVWSLACPEILDFRMAPIWGFVIAVTGMTAREEREAQAAAAEAGNEPPSGADDRDE
jgi:hypothetical protein